MPVKNSIAAMHEEITGWRRHLHQIPELLYDLDQTSAFVVERLKEFGITDITTGVGRSGIVAVIEGRANSSGNAIGLRADMDALPIQEATGLDYASKTPGKMHACGHDGHTAMLLGTAKYLQETRNFDGKVVLIFQPAEEGGAGALAMVEDGLMDRWNVREVYGMHNAPGIDTDTLATRPGPFLASSDEFEIIVTGKGGHAAAPHEAIDTTLVACQTVVALNTLVSRTIDPIDRVVLTVGTFETDSASSNIIAHTVRMRGTVRALDQDCRQGMEARVRAVAEHTALAHGATAEVNWRAGYPITDNAPEQTEHALDAARAVTDTVDPATPPILPSEDFSYMLEARPGAFMFLGNGDSAPCHHPGYDFNDEAIPLGCSWFAELVERRLPLG